MAAPPAIGFCACCTPSLLRPQADVLNRPGLSAISYRVGSFATFRQALLESIASEPRLAALTSRADDEYAVTLIELFAAMGDVLTFYNERIANELFLRTARERDSVLRLVRLIGYRLRPGLAATAMLAFSLDAGAETRIRQGLKVMSVPGQDEQPQTFETLEQIVAHADLNEVPAFAPPLPFEAFRQGSVAGPIVVAARSLRAGRQVRRVRARRDRGEKGRGAQNRPRWRAAHFRPAQFRLHCSGRASAAPPRSCDGCASSVTTRRQATTSTCRLIRRRRSGRSGRAKSVDGSLSAGLSDYPLDGRYDDLQPGAQLLVDAGPGQQPRLRTAVVTAADTRPAALGPLEDSVTHVSLRQTIRGRPALAAFPPSGHLVFARSGSGAAQWLEVFPPRRWTFLDGAEFTADLAITITAASRLDVLVRDAARTLRQRRYQGVWGAWVDHGGFLTSEPRAPAARSDLAGVRARARIRPLDDRRDGRHAGHLDSARRPPDFAACAGLAGRHRHGSLRAGSRSRTLAEAPRRRHLVGLGIARAACWRADPRSHQPVPAASTSSRAAMQAMSCTDRFDGSDWSDWRDLGGDAVDEPAIVAAAPDRVDIFVRSSTGELRHIARDGANWSPWFGLEGKLTSAPAALRDGPALHVYARGADGAIVHRSWTGSAWQPWLSHGDGLGAIAERRATRIYEISPDEIEFRPFDYPAAASSGQVAIRLTAAQKSAAGSLDRLAKGRRILLKSGSRQHLARVTATRPLAAEPGGPADHLLVDFAAALPSPFPDAVLLGNIAEASHGETQPAEPLGHGDAAQPFQKFTLQRAPVTYLPSATKIAGEAALEIRVNGERWTEVPSLYGRASTERIYTARQSDEGETTVTFGDGRTGARLPSGALNVVARYRKGLGLAGRMKAGQLSTPLERPPGLRAVVNPLAADGGADPEKRDDARYAAPGTVRTFGRAVSLLDFEWIATTSGLVQRAYVTWVWHQLERAVHLTVAAPAGEKLSVASLQKLYAALNTARDPNRQLFLANLVRVPVVVRAKVVADPALEPDAVRDSARAALLAFFAFEAVPLGRAVHASSVYAALQAAHGVVAADVDVFHLKGYAGPHADGAARPAPSPALRCSRTSASFPLGPLPPACRDRPLRESGLRRLRAAASARRRAGLHRRSLDRHRI